MRVFKVWIVLVVLTLPNPTSYTIYVQCRASVCGLCLHPDGQIYSGCFTSRSKRTTPLLLWGSGLSSGGAGSPPAAPWEWWWLGPSTSCLASLGGSTWCRHQRRRRQKETRDEAFLSGGITQVSVLSTPWALIAEEISFSTTLSLLITNVTYKCSEAILIQSDFQVI